MILQVIQYRSIGECIREIPPWRFSKRSRNDGRYNTSPSEFQCRNMFMSMFNDIEWWTSQNESKCLRDAVEVANYSRNVAHGCWSFLGSEKWKATWFGTSRDTTKEKWNDIGHKVKQIPIERTPDIFNYPLERSQLKSRRGRETIHFYTDFKQSWIAYEDDIGSESNNHLPRCINLVRPSAEDSSRQTWLWYWIVFQRHYEVSTASHPWCGWSNGRACCDSPSSWLFKK